MSAKNINSIRQPTGPDQTVAKLIHVHGAEVDIRDGQPTHGSVVLTAANVLPAAMQDVDQAYTEPPQKGGEGIDKRTLTWRDSSGQKLATEITVAAVDGVAERMVARIPNE